MKYLKHINQLDAHHRLIISLIVALSSYFLISKGGFTPRSFLIVWLSYSVCHLLLSWITILFTHPLDAEKTASIQDASKSFIFVFVIAAALAGLFSVVLLLGSSKSLIGEELVEYTLLSICSVISSWWILHTVFAFRYTHLYYQPLSVNKTGFVKGLDFPEEDNPDYLDFAYFSFIIGMTFQVSDVQIQSKAIRRLCLLHSLISFVFNTVIIALSISVISNLL
ncbi:hypothetical protein A5893_05960 [Pedobacter psychrophilus]|uniref:DUF1345 domain-containing protein n=1 Tax=Pedobacter psychrophilus TaxID=1826909 RepID=A0A179DIE5_9SPHI|nr:DUF1345 domain-containing protein [Pedobacter psychrophilus]OAQ40490.1 hypothetical protein A5893_05960 [Pedobacter psychrophilus]